MESPQPVNRRKARTWAVVGGVLAAATVIGAGLALAQQASKPKPATPQATELPASPTGYPIVTGSPGSPAAREFPDSRVLPTPTPPFTGVIKPNLIDSTPGWPSTIAPPKGAPNVLLILIDDAGFGSNSVFGGVVPTPTLEKLAQRGLRYHADAQHGAVLADPGGAAHRAQPPRRRLRRCRRRRDRLPRL